MYMINIYKPDIKGPKEIQELIFIKICQDICTIFVSINFLN